MNVTGAQPCPCMYVRPPPSGYSSKGRSGHSECMAHEAKCIFCLDRERVWSLSQWAQGLPVARQLPPGAAPRREGLEARARGVGQLVPGRLLALGPRRAAWSPVSLLVTGHQYGTRTRHQSTQCTDATTRQWV